MTFCIFSPVTGTSLRAARCSEMTYRRQHLTWTLSYVVLKLTTYRYDDARFYAMPTELDLSLCPPPFVDAVAYE